MPKFPRFTSGTFGRLDFATMNDMFDRIEQLEAKMSQAPVNQTSKNMPVFLAKITQTIPIANNCVKAAFYEVEYQSPCGLTVQTKGGRTSWIRDPYDYPIIGKSINGGDVIPVMPTYMTDGQLIYIPVGLQSVTPSFGGVRPMMIVGATNIRRGMWEYTCEEAVFNGDDWSSGGTQYTAYNVSENPVDAFLPSSCCYGVGFNNPGNLQQLERAPIRTTTVVLVFDTNPLTFCCENGYVLSCNV